MEPLNINISDVRQISEVEALDLPRGSVILVRSDYKNEVYGDHPSLILGGTIQKERGVRPNLLTFNQQVVANIKSLLNGYDPINGKVLLLLNDHAAKRFMESQGIHLSAGQVHEVEVVNKLHNILNP